MSSVRKTVFVGLSGGVDSSIAALLLKNEGYHVVGAFIKSYNVDGCEEEDAEYARRAAEKLDIPFYVFDMREEYFSRVVAEMIDGYRAGITPNPDVLCNREIKFGLFWERAKSLGADYIATGHYARRIPVSQHRASAHSSDAPRATLSASRSAEGGTEPGTPPRVASKQEPFSLMQAKDTNKDQTYFLWKLTQDDLEHCLFPVGEHEKPEVRKIAAKAGLPAAERKDSQGICFLGKVKLPEFLKKYISPKKGDIVDTEGRKIGSHDGAWFYTIGQRHINASLKNQKSNIKNQKDRKPYYVSSKDVEKNVIVVAEGENHPALYKKEIKLTDVNFITTQPQHTNKLENVGVSVMARVRYRQPLAPATIYKIPDTEYYKLLFDASQKFIAPGQSAVLYSGKGELLGGGIII